MGEERKASLWCAVLLSIDDLGVHLSECLLPLGRVMKKTGRSEENQKKAEQRRRQSKYAGGKKECCEKTTFEKRPRLLTDNKIHTVPFLPGKMTRER